MRKIIASLFILCMASLPVSAESIQRYLNSRQVNTAAVSVSIKNIDTGETLYSLNARTPRVPASTLKLMTLAASLDALGYDYKFSTQLYKSAQNELYLKLGADPLLKSSDLTDLMKIAASKNIVEPKKFYVDNTITDNVEWGEGWQWDDDLNPSMPKFGAYNLDGGLINIEVTPINNNSAPSVSIKPFYPVTIMNFAKTVYKSDNTLKLERNNSISPNILNLSGIVSQKTVFTIPVNNTQVYFNLRLKEAVDAAKIANYDNPAIAKLPADKIYFVGEVTHDITDGMNAVLKNSDNYAAESIFKIAGGQYKDATGTSEYSLMMLKDYFDKLGIKSDDIKVVDGSGVSKNNLMTADFMTSFLNALAKDENFETFKGYMASPSEGTLKNRMLYFKDSLKAKTGTLSDASAIAGYIKTRSGKIYSFDIMIQDAKTSVADKKNIEEQILRQIYMNY